MPENTTPQPSTNQSDWFEYHPDYSLLTSGPHRKPPIPIGTPALVWHSAFWIPDRYTDKPIDPSLPEIPRDEWVKNIEQFILNIYHDLARPDHRGQKLISGWQQRDDEEHLYLLRNWYKVSPDDRNPNPIGPHAARFQTVHLTFPWHSMPVDVGIELHTEYFALSTVIDLSSWTLKKSGNGELDIAEKLDSAIREFNSVASERFRKIQTPDEMPDAIANDQMRFKAAYELFYDGVWKAFYDEIIRSPFDKVGSDNLGQPFSDFRTFIATRGSDSSFITLPGQGPHVEITEPGRIFAEKEDVHCVNTILPFMAVRDRPDEQEHSYSNFLNGRCLFATALGAPPEQTETPARPLTQLLLFTHHDHLQIGRLVDRGDLLGDFRIAALYGFQHIIRAGHRLSGLAQELQRDVGNLLADGLQGRNLEKTRQGLGDEPNPVQREINIETNIQYFAKRLGEISTSLAQIGERRERRENENRTVATILIHSGLENRIRNSQYYHQNFQAGLEALHSKIIEDFQPYDLFVARRFGGRTGVHKVPIGPIQAESPLFLDIPAAFGQKRPSSASWARDLIWI